MGTRPSHPGGRATAAISPGAPTGSQLAVTALFSDPGGPFLEVNSLGAFAPPPDAGLTPTNRSSNGITRVSPFDAVYQQLGWRDGTQVLVLGLPTEELAEREDSVPGIYSIDIATGDYERLASVSLDDDAWIRGIATTLGANTFADRPGPTDHADPRAVWARVAALLFVAAMVGLVILQTRRSQKPCASAPGGHMMAPDAVDFETFVAARAAALSRTAYLLTGNHHDAEDLVETTLFKAARSWHRLKGEPEPYVRRIMYNENVSRWRRRRVAEFATSPLPEQPTADADVDTKLALTTSTADADSAPAHDAGPAVLRRPHRGSARRPP